MTLTRRHIAVGEVDHERWWLLVAACLITLALAAPGLLERPPLSCPFKTLSGIPCPTCGGLRAVAALLGGDLMQALRLNPLTTAGLVTFFFWLLQAAVAVVFGQPRWRVEGNEGDLSGLRWTSAIAVVATWGYLIVDGR